MRATPTLLSVLLCATIGVGGCIPACEDVSGNPLEQELEDDTAPPEPEHDSDLDYMGRYEMVENHSTERFRFDVPPFENEEERDRAQRLFASHAQQLRAYPDAIPSVQTLWTYLKQLDDTIYAGVELAVQQGLEPTVTPKRELLEEILDHLVSARSEAADEAIVYVAAALELGGASPTVPPELMAEVGQMKQDFLDDTTMSKPIGFYTWSDELQQIWHQDRLLQQPQCAYGTARAYLSLPAACAMAEAIAADPDLTARYQQLTELYTRLTNPLSWSLLELLPVAGTPACLERDSSCSADLLVAFLGPSTSPETELYKKLYGMTGLPEGASLMDDLIAAIRAGTVDLAPGDEDGWYAHKLFALETMLVTDDAEERAKIAFTARYKKRLQEAFKTMYTQTRETHIKQLEIPMAGSAGPPPVPHFRLEPLATVYARVARSYLFLEAALEEVMGAGLLDQGIAYGVQGALGNTLRQQLQRCRDLAFGLYALSCQDIGLRPTLDEPAGDPSFAETWETLAAEADQWLLDLADDPMADSDVRVLVPVGQTEDGRVRYWAVVGVRTTVAGYSYLHSDDMSPPAEEDLARVPLPTEQFIEVTSDAEPMTRDEFRALCDQHESAEEIQAALEGRGPGADDAEVLGCSALASPAGASLAPFLVVLLIGALRRNHRRV